MKKIEIKYILPAVAALILATSCTNLDVDIKSQLTKFPDTEAAIEAASADIYNAYRDAMGHDHWFVQTVSSDEAVAVSLGADYYDEGKYMQMHLHNWTPNNVMLGIFTPAMSGVTSCNTVLTMLDDDDSPNAAPIRAMRALYYFYLMDNFGGVPIVTTLVDENPQRATRKEVCEFIESELLAIRDNITTEVNSVTYGKPTRYMVDALLAKLYLNWAVYTASDVALYEPTDNNPKLNDVVAMCDDVISSGKYDLSNGYREKFFPNNGSHIKDFIFVIEFDRERQLGMTYARFWIHRNCQKQFADLPQSVGGNMRILPEFYDKFNLEGDERNETILTGKQYYWENYQETDKAFTIETTPRGFDQDYSGADADDPFEWHLELTKEITVREDGKETLDCGNDLKGRSMGYRSIKFYMDTDVTAANERNQSNDVPVFRYADILLMKAEAILRGATATNGDTPASLLNQIRAYVGAPAFVGTPTLEDILDERACEFADESWRRNDLIRYGKFEDDWGFRGELYPQGLTEKFRRIFPIHIDVMNANTHWSQNPGY